jgi:hypothetical protein
MMTSTIVMQSLLSILSLLFPFASVSFVLTPGLIHRGDAKIWLLHCCSNDESLLAASEREITNNRRRRVLRSVFDLGRVSLMGSGALALGPSRADATYSAYAQREKDWIERQNKGEINISTPKDLRRQLRDIAPMNDDTKSKIFCPNGPSAAVSPLMENKCGDRLATPSVYGRRQDIVGNSIPGLSYYGDEVAFPKYNSK